MLSVIIAAHDEESVIGATLDALLADPGTEGAEVIVSANGCSDRTVGVAAARGVIVVDRPEPGKAAALNAADGIATGKTRMYLDADIRVPFGAVATLLGYFDTAAPPLAVVPRRRMDTSASSWGVRAYVSVSERLPAFRHGLFGRGLILLSETGRAKFEEFPALIADDLYVDSRFADDERAEAPDVVITVEAPRTARSLLRRLIRVRRGNAQLRAAAARGELDAPVRPADRLSWWRDVVAPDPRLLPAGVVYCAITLLASVLARRPPKRDDWAPDRSTGVTHPPRTASGAA